MTFILWLAMLIGGLVLKAQTPEPFDGAYTAGTIMVWVAIGMAVLNLLIVLGALLLVSSQRRAMKRRRYY